MNAKIKFLGLAGMVSFLLVSCSKDEVQSSRQGEAITFNTNVTRATETSTQTLTKIKVYADAEGYKNMFIKGDVAEKKGSDNIFRFSTNYYWPNDVDVIKFWAYGPADIKNVVPNITGDGQSFETYTPASGVNNPGAKHEDLVVAYTKADRHSGTGSNIKLVFNHAFTQVIVKAKKDFNFRLLVDDAHGFGTMGPGGRGTAAHFGVVDEVDVLFNTFAKSMAGIGAFVSGPRWLINLFRYNMRSQLYAKSLPMPMVIGALKRMELIRNHPEYQQKLWEITNALQSGLKENGFDIGVTQSPVTPIYMKGGNEEGTNLIVDLRENHSLFCSIVIYPVIPKGEIILRVIPTAAHTMEDVEYTINAFKAVRDKFEAGYYRLMPIPLKADPEFKVR